MSRDNKSSATRRATKRRRLLGRLVATAATLAGVAALLAGIVWVGDQARRHISTRDRYTVPFAAIVCDVPAGRDRFHFLSEVRYLAELPETLQSLDPDLTAKLTRAFTLHPWVAAVEGVDVEPSGTVRVRLRFRTPTLAVPTEDGVVRVVDADGVLLPAEAPTAGLPRLSPPLPPPATPAGRPWTDATISRALELLDAHRFRVLEVVPEGWRLTLADGRVVFVGR